VVEQGCERIAQPQILRQRPDMIRFELDRKVEVGIVREIRALFTSPS